MSDEFWLRCEKCGRSLDDSAGEAMQLVAMFKPALLPARIPKAHPKERRHRCRCCGWVNVFVPSAPMAAEPPNSLLTAGWRSVTLKKEA